MEPAAVDTAGTPAGADEQLGYWRETRQPIYSAALILPFVVVYELGILILRSDVINGGDAIMRTLFGRMLSLLDVRIGSLSVVVLILFFLVWQIRKKGRWRLQSHLLILAYLESLCYAVLLFLLLGYLLQYLPRTKTSEAPTRGAKAIAAAVAPAANPASAQPEQLAPCQAGGGGVRRVTINDFVLYCGAGVYEEFVFRVMLLALLILIFNKLFHMEHAVAAAWAVVLGALIFSAFHHIGGEPFSVGMFLQRALAGLYFAAIYLNRSYGVAAASHALYDILIGLNLLRRDAGW